MNYTGTCRHDLAIQSESHMPHSKGQWKKKKKKKKEQFQIWLYTLWDWTLQSTVSFMTSINLCIHQWPYDTLWGWTLQCSVTQFHNLSIHSSFLYTRAFINSLMRLFSPSLTRLNITIFSDKFMTSIHLYIHQGPYEKQLWDWSQSMTYWDTMRLNIR